MLYSKQQVQENLRNRDGKRVFYLGKEDLLTSEARDFLTSQRIQVISSQEAATHQFSAPDGAIYQEKPEHLTHLNGDILVAKTHPRIRFRGSLDTLQGAILLCQKNHPALAQPLQEILALTRLLIRCDVLNEPVGDICLCGLSPQQQRQHSHFPQKHYGIPHFMPNSEDGDEILSLNWVRCLARQAELLAVDAFTDRDGLPTRTDILQAMNRISSILYILMLREKAKNQQEKAGSNWTSKH